MHRHRVAHYLAHQLPLAFGALSLAAVIGCSGDIAIGPEPDSRPTNGLHFLRPASDAPPLANPVVQFYAKRGDNREAFIYYQRRPGRSDSTEFMRFRVHGSALAQRPDGTTIVEGDSILITIRVVDPARLILEFQPSGLRFAASRPAELKIRFAEANDDLDGDGDVDADDSARERELAIWKQEAPGLPWLRMASVVDFSLDEVEADVFSFTGYAIAY
jgi:hypothetical protein